MDVLSEVLTAVRLEGALFFNAEFSAPWCLSEPRSTAAAPYLSPAPVAGHLILYHFLTEGRAYAKLQDGRREELIAGDIVVFPHGDAHVLGNGSPVKPVDSLRTFAKNLAEGLKLARFGGGGEITRFVCGYLACEPRLSEVFLAGLPPMLKVHVAQEPSGQWLEHSIRFTVEEADGAGAGSGLVLAKLSELLFVETLRRYINALPPDQTGWLAGARDPVTGQALALLHKRPADPWTISNLARRVGLSRTRLAERFRHFLGESPMAYLTRWRLRLGAEMLQSTEDSVAEVAAAVGYGSEAAFNRAFKREFGCPPGQFRRKRRVPPAQNSRKSPPRG
ncbi:MAG TPA: AraC family transcriptional regulator [Pyrinomonadaceae bacterium]|jgi:AraC-like DNA-binding protein|nr:AraC family transcriptional regulator [Pyrinomonadaceae bacterium]